MEPAELEKYGDNLKGIILSGGPFSVYDDEAPHVAQGIWDMAAAKGLPVLGICYGLQEIAHAMGGTVAPAEHREYGHAMVRKIKKRTMETDGESKDTESAATSSDGAGLELFAGLEDEFKCWMSHGDKLTALPAGYECIPNNRLLLSSFLPPTLPAG